MRIKPEWWLMALGASFLLWAGIAYTLLALVTRHVPS